jgi:hypothetical protein
MPLQCGAVVDQAGDEPADARFDVRLGFGMMLEQRPVGRNERVNLCQRDDVVSVGARHLRVDLRDNEARGLDGGLRGVARGAERAQSMRVGR